MQIAIGTACFILMDDAAKDFRATTDIDMILVLEDKREAFSNGMNGFVTKPFVIEELIQEVIRVLDKER